MKRWRRQGDKAALQQSGRGSPETRLIDPVREFAGAPSAISNAPKRWGITVKKCAATVSQRQAC